MTPLEAATAALEATTKATETANEFLKRAERYNRRTIIALGVALVVALANVGNLFGRLAGWW